MNRSMLAGATAATLLAVPASAEAHVTLNPREATAGSFSVLAVRVPNERDNKDTVKVDVRLPDGIFFLSYKKARGWKTTLTREQLDRPVDLEGFQVDEQFTRVTWTGRPKRGGIIRPDQFEEFPLSLRVPDGKPGDFLAFPAVQTYRGGEKVRWVGAPDADEPAPRVKLLAPQAESSASGKVLPR